MNDRDRRAVVYALHVLQEHSYLYNPSDHAALSEDEIDGLIAALDATPPDTPVLIVVEGGLIQSVITDAPIAVTVIDYDTECADDDEICEVPQSDGSMEDAFVYHLDREPLDERMTDFLEWGENQ
jgi:hypothetical protein